MKFGPLPIPLEDVKPVDSPKTRVGQRFHKYNKEHFSEHSKARAKLADARRSNAMTNARQMGKTMTVWHDEMHWIEMAIHLDNLTFSEVTAPDGLPVCVLRSGQTDHQRQVWVVMGDELHRLKDWYHIEFPCENWSRRGRLNDCFKEYVRYFSEYVGSVALVVRSIRYNNDLVYPKYPRTPTVTPRTMKLWFENEADAVHFSLQVTNGNVDLGVPFFYEDRSPAEPDELHPWW